MSGKKVVHYHRHHHHHIQEEIMRAFTCQGQGKTVKETALLCGVSESAVKGWNRRYRIRGKAFLKSEKKVPRESAQGPIGESIMEPVRFGISLRQSNEAENFDDRCGKEANDGSQS